MARSVWTFFRLTHGSLPINNVLTDSSNQCLEECRYKTIMENCTCRPPYLPAWANLPRCTFSQHAQCITPQFMHFNFSIKCEACPVECEKHSYGRNVEYGKYHEPIYRTLDKYSQSTGNTGIDIAAFQVRQDHWSYGVTVSTLDSESSDPSSNLGRTSLFSGLFSRTRNDRSPSKTRLHN